MRFAVCVTMHIKPEHMDAFLPLMHENAHASLSDEPHCHQFDVAIDAARPNEVFLYETYSNADAFAAHLETAHFKRFDVAVADMIVDKDVRTYEQVTP